MSKACILVKSPNPDTYRAIVKEVQKRLGKLERIEWVFFQMSRDRNLIPSELLEERVEIGIQSVDDPDELIHLFKEIDLCDVSALPKEDFAEIIALVMGRKKPSVCTLTRNPEVSYIDLMSQDAVKSFNNSYVAQRAFSRAIITVAVCGLIALALVKLLEIIPNAETWTIWISIGVGLLGVAQFWQTFRYA